MELCIFDDTGRRELQRIELRERTDEVWHCYLPGGAPGPGVRLSRARTVSTRKRGYASTANKLLLDPYAREIVGRVRWSDALYGYTIGHAREDLSFDRRDSARYMPKGRVVETAFSWGDDRHPSVPWHETVIYETERARLHDARIPRCRPRFAAPTPRSARAR